MLKKLLLVALAALALAGCANTEYLKSVDKANETRLALASADIKAQAADSMADEAGFNALAAATKSADPVTSAIAASQLGTALAVRSLAKAQAQSKKSSAQVVQNPERPRDVIDYVDRILHYGVAGFAIAKNADVDIARINASRDIAISHDATIADIADNVVGVTGALAVPLAQPGTVNTITADRGASVNVGGSQTVTRTDTQSVTCTTGSAGNGGSGVTGGTSTAPGGAGGAAGSNNCSASTARK